jgi:hypothetical protein
LSREDKNLAKQAETRQLRRILNSEKLLGEAQIVKREIDGKSEPLKSAPSNDQGTLTFG